MAKRRHYHHSKSEVPPLAAFSSSRQQQQATRRRQQSESETEERSTHKKQRQSTAEDKAEQKKKAQATLAPATATPVTVEPEADRLAQEVAERISLLTATFQSEQHRELVKEMRSTATDMAKVQLSHISSKTMRKLLQNTQAHFNLLTRRETETVLGAHLTELAGLISDTQAEVQRRFLEREEVQKLR